MRYGRFGLVWITGGVICSISGVAVGLIAYVGSPFLVSYKGRVSATERRSYAPGRAATS